MSDRDACPACTPPPPLLLADGPNGSEADIKKAYRKKAKEQHPDKNIDDPRASEKFQEMAAAYEILSDPETREVYDMHGMAGLEGSAGSAGMNEADLFSAFFGSGMFGFGGPRRNQESVIPYDTTLEDLYNGKSVKMNMEKEAVCGLCKGSGARGNAKPKPCVTCDGKGWTFVQTQVAPSVIGTSRSNCHSCEGTGSKLREKDRCKKCKGKKTTTEKTRQEIFIEKGMEDKQRIVLSGAGDQRPGQPPEDVVFVLRCAQHDSFERAGDDLLMHVSITLSEALLGFSRILIKHLDGRGIHLRSPSGKIIKHHDSIVLRGEGMPKYKHPDQKGDLYVIFDIEMPDEQWLKSVDKKALENALPPKKRDVEPRPAVVDEAAYEESDIVDFGGGEDAWVDEDEDDEFDEGHEPECRPQ
ncbi:DnaJ-domain-containing protein [Pleurotus pulmonarius]